MGKWEGMMNPTGSRNNTKNLSPEYNSGEMDIQKTGIRCRGKEERKTAWRVNAKRCGTG